MLRINASGGSPPLVASQPSVVFEIQWFVLTVGPCGSVEVIRKRMFVRGRGTFSEKGRVLGWYRTVLRTSSRRFYTFIHRSFIHIISFHYYFLREYIASAFIAFWHSSPSGTSFLCLLAPLLLFLPLRPNHDRLCDTVD